MLSSNSIGNGYRNLPHPRSTELFTGKSWNKRISPALLQGSWQYQYPDDQRLKPKNKAPFSETRGLLHII